jgi:hypothetical protein
MKKMTKKEWLDEMVFVGVPIEYIKRKDAFNKSNYSNDKIQTLYREWLKEQRYKDNQ